MLSAVRIVRPAVTRCCASHVTLTRTPTARALLRSIASPQSIGFTRRPLAPAAPFTFPATRMTSRSLTQRAAASKDADSDVVAASVAAPGARSSDRSDAAAADSDGADDADGSSDRFWFVLAGLSGGVAVCLGAFGAHGLKTRVSSPYFLEIWQTAAHYHLVHALAMGLAPVVVGALLKRRVQRGQSVAEALRANLFGGKQRGSKFIADAAQRAAATAAILRLPRRNLSASCFLAGTVVFSGSLYALTLTENRKWGAVTPIGGVAFILGWIFLALGL